MVALIYLHFKGGNYGNFQFYRHYNKLVLLDLLFHNQNRIDLSFIIQFYIDRLREKNLASNIGSLYIDRLLEAFMQYYPSDYLELMQSELGAESQLVKVVCQKQ